MKDQHLDSDIPSPDRFLHVHERRRVRTKHRGQRLHNRDALRISGIVVEPEGKMLHRMGMIARHDERPSESKLALCVQILPTLGMLTAALISHQIAPIGSNRPTVRSAPHTRPDCPIWSGLTSAESLAPV